MTPANDRKRAQRRRFTPAECAALHFARCAAFVPGCEKDHGTTLVPVTIVADEAAIRLALLVKAAATNCAAKDAA